MTETDDIKLLQQYAWGGSEIAFAKLVERHLNLVYATALRRTGSPQAAEEITQAVFIILAKKAGALGRNTVLSGWLYHTARLTAANFLRGEIRRQQREQEAHMQSLANEPGETWMQIAPLLENAMADLSTRDRDALVLRFFENKNLRDVGAALGASEDAAKMRVNRALEKLRKILVTRGVHSTATVIAGAVSTHSVHAAPLGLAKTISTIAVAKGAAAGGSTLALVKRALNVMAWTKAKTVAVAAVGILLATGITVVVAKKIVASTSYLAWADDPHSWALNSQVLENLPAGAFILRPTRFPQSGGGVWVPNRGLERNRSVGDLIDSAYGFPSTRTVFPPELPADRFDYLATIPNGKQHLRDDLKNRFNLTAHRETREMDVLLIKVSSPNPPNLRRNVSNSNSTWIGAAHKDTIVNYSLGGFLSDVENRHMEQPVLDRTGLTGRYDIQIDWKPRRGESEKDAYKRALSEQLGLELVPSREPIEVLVIEKTN